MRKWVVLGIGNVLLQDDGIGIHVVRELQAQVDKANDRQPASEDDTVHYIDGGTLGFLLSQRLADSDGMVIVDAAQLHQPVGTVQVFSGHALHDFLRGQASASVHEVGLIDLLDMMTLDQQAPRQQALVGVQPASMDWGLELSPGVLPCVPQAARQVQQILSDWREEVIHAH